MNTRTHDGKFGCVPLLERLASKIEKTDSCWVWTASRDGNGYGNFSYLGKCRKAHRVVYEAYVGKIPDGLEIDHLCRNTSCVNPSHLEPVTRSVNAKRGKSGWKVERCKRYGHPLSGDNLGRYFYKRGGVWQQYCKRCKSEYNKSKYWKLKEGK